MVFGPAIRELSASERSTFGPTSFRDYVVRHDVDAGPRTPRYISVDSLEDLPPSLAEAGAMVLRVGSAPDGTGTAFVLVDSPGGAGEFFLRDESVFAGQPVERVEEPPESDRLSSYRVLPTLSETSLVNLGLASGVLADALELDTSGPLAPPATGRSTFTFEFRPHGDCSETVTHRHGQVEIDTLFVERRGGESTLFVLEAKTGPRASLAKHKLVYALLAVADSVPAEIELVPVYLRCRQADGVIAFDVAECALPDPRERIPGVNELESRRSRVIELELE
ncbi:hypothetical protein AB7C87_10265 [Natrarchaeobius sp. A-rgal3]|uniref:DUF6997 domain-containing protein n=1 Tax=Natrarchaeobius versutus TaxID=1679078 RepID=UPI003510C388